MECSTFLKASYSSLYSIEYGPTNAVFDQAFRSSKDRQLYNRTIFFTFSVSKRTNHIDLLQYFPLLLNQNPPVRNPTISLSTHPLSPSPLSHYSHTIPDNPLSGLKPHLTPQWALQFTSVNYCALKLLKHLRRRRIRFNISIEVIYYKLGS